LVKGSTVSEATLMSISMPSPQGNPARSKRKKV
jgi:hypothetical protein